MKFIKLKDLYPDTPNDDTLIVVKNTVANELNRNHCTQDIEVVEDIEELAIVDDMRLLRKIEMNKYMFNRLFELSIKQSNRIYEHFYLGITKSEIARIEGCSESAVRKSINQGLIHLRRHMKKYLRE